MIECQICHNDFEYLGRGRPPKKCPTCREKLFGETISAINKKATAAERLDRLDEALKSRNLHISQHRED
jgi:hypothetical protein